MRPWRLSKRERFLLALLAVLLVINSGYRYLYRPLLTELRGLEAAVEEAAGYLAQKSQLVAGGKEIGEEYRRQEETYRELLELLPDNKDLAGFLLELERALTAREIKLLSFEPVGEERQGELALCSVRLNLQGSFPDIAAFLEELATLTRLAKPVELKLYGGGASDAVLADLYLEVYYLPGDGEST